jgi:hypothetical protein
MVEEGGIVSISNLIGGSTGDELVRDLSLVRGAGDLEEGAIPLDLM